MTRMEEYAFTKADKALPSTPVKTIRGTFDSTWKDQLLTWNGVSMTYDAIGNMVKKGNTTYTWTQGRKLSTVNNGKKIQYFYDHTGRRVRKTVDGVITDFRMAGEILMSQKAGDVTTYFSYDSAGNLIGMSAGSNRYFYTRNAQNDITGLIDENGTSVVQYQYDSWGKLLGITGSLASTIGKRNPFRYRGYYYDDETGMYYLQSRYYDPEIKRFICADSYCSTGQGLNCCNIFIYCSNNPINMLDSSGQFGQFFVNIWNNIVNAVQTFISGSGLAMVGGGAIAAGAIDGPLPVGDIIGIAAIVGTYLFSQEKDDVQIKAGVIEKTKPDITIYRYGETKPSNLTPKMKDRYTGVSFSTIPPQPGKNAAVTTIHTINSTGILYAYQDSLTHVTVIPTNASIMEWIKAGNESIWTMTLQSVVVKWDGGR